MLDSAATQREVSTVRRPREVLGQAAPFRIFVNKGLPLSAIQVPETDARAIEREGNDHTVWRNGVRTVTRFAWYVQALLGEQWSLLPGAWHRRAQNHRGKAKNGNSEDDP